MELRDYLKILRKRWWIIALVALIAVASAYVFSKTQPTIPLPQPAAAGAARTQPTRSGVCVVGA